MVSGPMTALWSETQRDVTVGALRGAWSWGSLDQIRAPGETQFQMVRATASLVPGIAWLQRDGAGDTFTESSRDENDCGTSMGRKVKMRREDRVGNLGMLPSILGIAPMFLVNTQPKPTVAGGLRFQ